MIDTDWAGKGTNTRTMDHSEIQNLDIIERYVRNQLSAEERRAFQEHFFTCDECFGQVQMTERFIGGVRNAAESGLITDQIPAPGTTALSLRWSRWIRPAFAATAAVALVLSAVIAWLLLIRLPALHEQIAAQRKAIEQVEREKQAQIDDLNARLRNEQSRITEREEATSSREPQARNESASSRARAGAEASDLLARNIPVVTLQATRAAEDVNELDLPAGAQRFGVYIEIAPQPHLKGFRLEVLNASGGLVATAEGLRLDKQNAVVGSLPAEPFANGDYLVKLYGDSQGQMPLVGEYKLRVKKR